MLPHIFEKLTEQEKQEFFLSGRAFGKTPSIAYYEESNLPKIKKFNHKKDFKSWLSRHKK